ncbi:amidophosphoribosyltransferase [Thermanaeromonas toyohensis ToBE]|uniref:Amidophosphoribosyltransferase n=1 Tax=Thermanaeromonas toyohensis ToBE TaxID=698762 RepID=A0A1W1W2K1_9FIRM|nr:amidophosphoribosyltransferase [Thermanaeromonas toyohensis]SMB99828.1 amidophosphoribosyltransferase [Thermanaeromonas toyohensis ToBE]
MAEVNCSPRWLNTGRPDKFREECGIFGLYGPGLDVARLTYYGLFALQHRGQESAGIAVSTGGGIEVYKGMGLVAEVFNQTILKKLQGNLAIGHVRYSTTGASSLANAQPLVARVRQGMIAVAHNGNLTNAFYLRQKLSAEGSVFQTTTDSEVILNLLARNQKCSLSEALLKCIEEIRGAYSLVIMTEDQLIGVRDPFGVRPLCLGKLGEAWVLASESCALDAIGATFIRDLKPGEILIIDSQGIFSLYAPHPPRSAHCIFEFIYFARPDSIIDGENVYLVRRELGRNLARECRVEADLVIPVPDSGVAAAGGYAEVTGIPLVEGLIKNRYAGRTFIQPTQEMRDLGVRLKLNPIRPLLQGKRVIIIDDSLVRGTTSRRIVQMLRGAGVKEVHLLIASPPVFHPCYYGIDTSAYGELIASRFPVDKITAFVGADTLYYLSLKGMLTALREGMTSYCTACFTGVYPIPLAQPQEATKYRLAGQGNLQGIYS